jgi:hypothetical protein
MGAVFRCVAEPQFTAMMTERGDDNAHASVNQSVYRFVMDVLSK